MRFKELFEVTQAVKPKVGREFQHAEDLVMTDGSSGALEALSELESMAQSVDDVTVKWDGSPAVFFGRNEAGEFVLTDAAGFNAKGYNGKVTNPNDLSKMILSRGKEVDDARKAFAGRMGNLWAKLEPMVEPTFRGYIKGDILYFTTPTLEGEDYTFKPNTVTYHIPRTSSIGQRIEKSEAGIVVHSITDLQGNTESIHGAIPHIKAGPVMLQHPVVANHLPTIDTGAIKKLRDYVTTHKNDIDSLLDDSRLASEKMSDFKATLYTFVNQQVDTGHLRNLNSKFDQWLEANPKISAPKKAKIQQYRYHHKKAFEAVFYTLEQIMSVKDNIITQLDKKSEVRASIGGKPGGEGYVKSRSKIKLVPRLHFTQANRAKHA
jgi:DNA uptake protein ComE-like DNA-binding protein